MHRDITEHRLLAREVWRQLRSVPQSMREQHLVKLAVRLGYKMGYAQGYREGNDDALSRWADDQQRKRLR